MSPGARWLLGSFCLIFAVILAVTSYNAPGPTAVVVTWLCAGFSFLISLACFSKSARGPAVQLIGLMVFVAYLAYFILAIRKGIWRPYQGRASEHWLNALLGMIFFGIPGLIVALGGRYPKWAQGSKVFRLEADEEIPSQPFDESDRD